GPWPLHQRSLLALAQGKALSPMQGSSLRHRRPRCGHDGQRKRVAHMPTAATTTEDSRSKLAQNHPHDFTMKDVNIWGSVLTETRRFTSAVFWMTRSEIWPTP